MKLYMNRESRLFPAPGPQRIAALRRQAFADGALDAAVLCRYEIALRPEALRWSDWIAGPKTKVFGVLDLLEAEAGRGTSRSRSAAARVGKT
jgi:glutathione S-transferase